MERYIGPNVTVTNWDTKYDGDFYPGLIELHKIGDLPRLRTAILSTLVFRYNSTTKRIESTAKDFVRSILDPNDGVSFGSVYVNRPSPDPDTRFQSLLDEPLLAGIPTGLRSEVDPASLIPLPTSAETCYNKTRCVTIFPVSSRIDSLIFVIDSNTVQVRRRFLLWPQTDEYGMPFRYNEFGTFSYLASDHVCCTILVNF